MDETERSPLTWDKKEVEAAIALADWSVLREALTRRNIHDLNGIRANIHAIGRAIGREGEKGFHSRFTVLANSKNPVDPLIYKGIRVLAGRLTIPLLPAEEERIKEATAKLSTLKLIAQRQPEDMQTDIRALKSQILPNGLQDFKFDYPTKHNPGDYEQMLIQQGVDEAQAAKDAAWLAISLNRIGLSLKRFNSSHNNPVDFLNLVTERMLEHNKLRRPNSVPPSLPAYLIAWRDEVKKDFLGVQDPETVKTIFRDTALDLVQPNRLAHPHQFVAKHDELPSSDLTERRQAFEHTRRHVSGVRYFRAQPDSDIPKALSPSVRHDITAIFTALADQYRERHNPTNYLQAFLTSDLYKQKDSETQRVISGIAIEICDRLAIDYPPALLKPNRQTPQPRQVSWHAHVEDQARAVRNLNVTDLF